jgi:hypothetical protein
VQLGELPQHRSLHHRHGDDAGDRHRIASARRQRKAKDVGIVLLGGAARA